MTVEAPVAHGDEEDCGVDIGVCVAVHAATKRAFKSAANSGDRCLSIVSFNRHLLRSITSRVCQRIPVQA
jgi:hypothetical protein